MSERGSFCTEYIYCGKCLDAAREVLLGSDRHLCSHMLRGWEGEESKLPIIAGKIGGLASNCDIPIWADETVEALSKVICHPMRIAVLDEDRHSFLTARPDGENVWWFGMTSSEEEESRRLYEEAVPDGAS